MQDSDDRVRRFRRVRFPVIGPLLIECPICNGSKCNVCNNTGEYEMEREGYVEVQEPLVVRYIMDNMDKGLPVKEVNYIVFIQIKDELWLREMFNKAYRKEV